MIAIREKIKAQGWRWFMRRVLREILQPVTKTGKYLKPFKFAIYPLLCKFMDIINYRRSKKSHADTLYFFYDLEVEPITYNFCWALAIAEARRKEHRLLQLKIIIVPGLSQGLRKEDSEYQTIVNDVARWWRIYSILLPTPMLLANQPSLYFCASREEALMIKKEARYLYPNNYSVTFPTTHQTKDGLKYKNFMSFRATAKARTYVSEWLEQRANHRKVIVITLRQYDYTPERNSNITAWAAFAKKLNKKEFFVVIVPDTEKASHSPPKPLQEFTYFEAACWNMGLRAALYELAYLNLGVNNGPMSLCWLNAHTRYVTFKMIVKEQSAATLENMLKIGFRLNQTPPFANQFQRWVWKDDEEEIISREFDSMYALLENKNNRQKQSTNTIM
ncbi:hypothetical protein FIV31_00165 [Coxiella endosymbiont of Ornithodoros amblus]|uniref:hypothetical protein n=1 Tax=Coxiella endosymbiont of Ornithodoros amblus TaxID=1656166 RepID=UPI00244DE7A5|nr:hypothetical protein [Coxiella endosymbiont of Ornithodoros amblus]MBW5802264.1 hypothetical protein [Coxiella endosymbiont of Ornithodoros amblus]